MFDKIYLENLIVSATLGCSDEERKNPQPVCLDIILQCDMRAAARSDFLEDTWDYVSIIETIEQITQNESFSLLEALCGRIAETVLQSGVTSIQIKASKKRCPIPGLQGRIAVELYRTSEMNEKRERGGNKN